MTELSLDLLPLLFAASLAAIAAFTDIRRFKVYNVVTFPAMLLGLAYHTFAPTGAGFAASFAGLFVALGIMVAPYLLGAFGAGDVKFFMALGSILGVAPLVPVFMVAVAATLVYSVVQAGITKSLPQLWMNAQISFLRFASLGKMFAADDAHEDYHDWVEHEQRYKRLIPFSAMLAIGLLVTVVWYACVEG